MMGIGWGEGILIVLVITLLFGAKRIPEVARSMGSAIGEFKKGMRGELDTLKKDIDPPAEPPEKKS
ncbi:MAG: twin-arginine translocase TatA/TatE family subunit [Candidatus Delongbacteria bacterium]